LKKGEIAVQDVCSIKPIFKYSVLIGENLFQEEWTVDIVPDWIDGPTILFQDGEEFMFCCNHYEFHGPKNGYVSETGYLSSFTQSDLQEKYIPEEIEIILKARWEEDKKRDCMVLGIKQLKKNYRRNART